MAPDPFGATLQTVFLTARTSLLAGTISLASTIPISFFIGVVWVYISMPREDRTLRTAVRRAFPLSDFGAASFKSDLWLFIFNKSVMVIVFGLITKTVAAVFSAEIFRFLLVQSFGNPVSSLTLLPLVISVQAITMIVAGDLPIYLWHLLTHKVPFLWSFHRTHHSAEALTLLTIGRAHPVDGLLGLPFALSFQGVVLGVALYWTSPQIHPLALFFFTAFNTTINGPWLDVMEHSRVRISYGKLNRIFTAPVLHQIHHSAELRHRDKNFGSALAVWDWMFGTQYIPHKDEIWRFGLNEHELGEDNPHKRVSNSLLEPFRYLVSTIRTRYP